MPEYPLPDYVDGRVAPDALDHAALAYYRFVPLGLEGDDRRRFLERVRDRFNAHQGERPWREACASEAARLAAAAESFRAHGRPVETFEMDTQGRLLVGMGYKNALEVGLTFHHPGGFPFLPGSSVKGLTRSWAEDVEEATPELVHRVFGTASKDEHDAERDMVAGAVCFLDALPVRFPRFDLDLMNPHYGAYYQDDADATPPGDWLEPKPITFLTVAPGQRFRFALVGRTAGDTDAVATAKGWLTQALAELGAGGKTSAGYGSFTPVGAAPESHRAATPAGTTGATAPEAAPAAAPQSPPAPRAPEKWAEVGRNSTGIPARVVGHKGRRMLVVRLHVAGYEQKDFPLGGVNGADFAVGDWITVDVANVTKRKKVAQVSFNGRLDV